MGFTEQRLLAAREQADLRDRAACRVVAAASRATRQGVRHATCCPRRAPAAGSMCCMHGLAAARALHPIMVMQRQGALTYCSRAARALQAERTTCVQQVSTGRQCGEGGRSMKLGTGQAGGSSGVVGNVAMAKDGMQTDDIFRGCQAMLVGLRSLVLVASWGLWLVSSGLG